MLCVDRPCLCSAELLRAATAAAAAAVAVTSAAASIGPTHPTRAMATPICRYSLLTFSL